MAYATGIPHTVWLEDTRALMTAVELIAETARRREGG